MRGQEEEGRKREEGREILLSPAVGQECLECDQLSHFAQNWVLIIFFAKTGAVLGSLRYLIILIAAVVEITWSYH